MEEIGNKWWSYLITIISRIIQYYAEVDQVEYIQKYNFTDNFGREKFK